MKSEETIYQDEETQIIDDTTPQSEPTTAKAEKKGGNGMWKRVVIGGVTGMVFGGASVFAANAMTGEEVITEEAEDAAVQGGETPVSDDSHITVDDSIQVAQVSDDMTFSEAFAEARAEVGAGGVFEWNGGVYGTYYADEWDEMSAEEREEFGSHINYGGGSSTTTDVAEDVAVEEEPVVVAEVAEQEQEENQVEVEVAEAEPDVEVDVAEADVEVVAVEEMDVQIVGVSEETLDDGSVLTVGQVQVDGEDVFYIDTNGDGTFNVAATDLNHDGVIGDGEYANVEDSGITVDTFDPNMGMEQDQYLASNDAPDYIGDDCNLA